MSFEEEYRTAKRRGDVRALRAMRDKLSAGTVTAIVDQPPIVDQPEPPQTEIPLEQPGDGLDVPQS